MINNKILSNYVIVLTSSVLAATFYIFPPLSIIVGILMVFFAMIPFVQEYLMAFVFLMPGVLIFLITLTTLHIKNFLRKRRVMRQYCV